ncbi:MAG: hypothetical protein ACPGRW_06305 [Flavobacteriaceae bacterium]
MSKKDDCNGITVTVKVKNPCCDDGQPVTTPTPTPKCIVVPYGEHIVFRNQTNAGKTDCGAFDGEIFMGYYQGVYGEYQRVSSTEVKIIKQTKTS